MYVPPRYRVTDDALIDEFIRGTGFATLVTTGPGGLMGSHIPVELARGTEGERLLRGHVSKANPQWKELEAGAQTMIVFLGAHAYVSPTWYDHPNVPTWNYQAVHAWGPVRVVHGKGEQLGQVRELSEHYEPRDQPAPRFDVDALPEAVREAELKGIVAFEMTVTRVDAAFKLSQNRNAGDHARIVRELEARGDEASAAVARAMKEAR